MTYAVGSQRDVLKVTLKGSQIEKAVATSAKNKGTLGVAWRHAPPDIAADADYRVVMTRGNWNALRKIPSLGLHNTTAQPAPIDLLDTLASYLAKQSATKP